ncbi:MAG: hypothetical protein EPN14_07650, partial [Gallionella sp.]
MGTQAGTLCVPYRLRDCRLDSAKPYQQFRAFCGYKYLLLCDPMETLHITNFLTIAQADICLNRFNVFIGPQARGKSIIVKLIYFFKREVGKALIDNVISGKNKRNLTVTLAAKFEAIFPKVYWGTQEFSMSYTHNCLDVRLVGTKTGASKVNLSITYSESLLKLHGDLKRHCQIVVKETQGKMDKAIAGLPRQASLFGEERMIISHILNFARTLEYDVFFEPQVFIPASRTFFANLQKNIFSFLASNIEIDPFLKEFGSVYENSKRFYKGKFVFGKDDDLVHKEIDRLVESIIAGRYLQENEQDWIIDSSRKINLANASSGQQEALPMLLALKAMSFSSGKPSQGFYIEEPEAHLFPASQKLVVSLLTMLA